MLYFFVVFLTQARNLSGLDALDCINSEGAPAQPTNCLADTLNNTAAIHIMIPRFVNLSFTQLDLTAPFRRKFIVQSS